MTPTVAAQTDLSVHDHSTGDPSQRSTDALTAHRQQTRRKKATILALAIVLIGVAICDVLVGSQGLRLGQALSALARLDSAPYVNIEIIWHIRMPMTMTGILVGAGLALAGAEMQTILNNPLAEPYTLGISAAASFGAALSLVLGFSALPVGTLLGTTGTAWLFAMGSAAVILAFSLLRGPHTETMILLGIAMVFLFSALLSLMQYVASDAQLQQVVFWTLGSLGRATWPQVFLLAGVLAIAVPALFGVSWQLTAMRLGDERARALGVSVGTLRVLVLAGLSMVAATAVAMAGSIGFVGLVGPHIARMLVGEDHRPFIVVSLLSGAILLCASSLAATLLVPGVIVPIGIVTSIVGVPVFLALILSRRRQLWA